MKDFILAAVETGKSAEAVVGGRGLEGGNVSCLADNRRTLRH